MELFSSLSECFGNGDTPDLTKGGCGWSDIGPIVNELLKNTILLGFFIATLMIFYAGYVLISKQGSADARSKAKDIFFGIAIGMVLLVGAYYIVEFVLDTLGVKEEYREGTIL